MREKKFRIEFTYERGCLNAVYEGSQRDTLSCLGMIYEKNKDFLELVKDALKLVKHPDIMIMPKEIYFTEFNVYHDKEGFSLTMGNPKQVKIMLAVFMKKEKLLFDVVEESVDLWYAYQMFKKQGNPIRLIASKLSDSLNLENTIEAMGKGNSIEEVTKIFRKDNTKEDFNRAMGQIEKELNSKIRDMKKDENPMDKIIQDYRDGKI